jgi:uncharacterized protein (TIGR03435 family)
MLRIRHNLILTGAIGLLLVVPYGRSQTQNAAAFEVASVKLSPPNRTDSFLPVPGGAQFNTTGMPLMILIQFAYGLNANQISGPDWIKTQQYDIAAKTEGGAVLTLEQTRPLLERLLVDRFKLVYHRETMEIKGFALVAAKSGTKLQASKAGAWKGANILRDGIEVPSGSMKTLAALLTSSLKQPVADKTGITGDYEIKLSFAPAGADDSTLPSIFTAVQEQLGLRLESQKVPVEMLVIDHVEKIPTEN